LESGSFGPSKFTQSKIVKFDRTSLIKLYSPSANCSVYAITLWNSGSLILYLEPKTNEQIMLITASWTSWVGSNKPSPLTVILLISSCISVETCDMINKLMIMIRSDAAADDITMYVVTLHKRI